MHSLLTLLSTIIKFTLDCIHTLFCSKLPMNKIDPPRNKSRPATNSNGKPKMESENIWFDGVNKRLLQAHTSDPKKLVEGDDQTLTTRTSLTPLSALVDPKRKKAAISDCDSRVAKSIKTIKHREVSVRPHTGVTDELAIDCEMVECFRHKSVLARVSIVNLFGHPILDRYVAPPGAVTDYRTRYSGIRPKDLADAPEFEVVQREVMNLIKGRIVVGHAIHNDFAVLKINHPHELVRDTSQYYKFLFQGKAPSLKKLTESLLGIKIQKGEHDSVQDAQATMKLYVKEREKWNERQMKTKLPQVKNNQKQKVKPKKKMKTFYVLTN